MNVFVNFTSKEVFAKRKEPNGLDEAYQMAQKLVASNPNDDWNYKALAWCLIDLVKREVARNNLNAASHYVQQLQSIKIASDDNYLVDGTKYAVSLLDPITRIIQQAKCTSKQGNHQQAINYYYKALRHQPHNQDIKIGLGWELYRFAKIQCSHDKINAFAVKKLLNNYLKLECETPSRLHSSFLRIADKLLGESRFNLVAFIRIWGINNFTEEDFEPYIDKRTNECYPSLAQKVVHHATKQALEQNDVFAIKRLLPLLERVISLTDDDIWLNLCKARALNCVGQYEEAFKVAIGVAKLKVGEYWAWELLGDIQLNVDKEKAFNCYCRALSMKPKEDFIAKLRLKLADLMVNKQMHSDAKREVQKVVEARNREEWAIPEAAINLQNSAWFGQVEASSDNESVYITSSKHAEELLFELAPWVHGCLGKMFSLKEQPHKKRQLIYLKHPNSNELVECALPLRRFDFTNTHIGQPVMMKGEFEADGHFNAFQFALRSDGRDWDVLGLHIGVVDHINREKKLAHIIIGKGFDGVIPLNMLPENVGIGDCVKVRAKQYSSKKGTRALIECIQPTEQTAPQSILKPFSCKVRISNGMGFTDDEIFIDRVFVSKFDIEDGQDVEGTAVINFNKKRSVWGWKAISIAV
ncbi:tetratricopeptide repeat protein [uncultured Photobacterium sp.]|uniref:tetratricopeptide repeat protein n=1 Tax=uncultured Photobacterium sp. TaxID=173973 RepID=UPI00261EF1B1|nr:tetratricopeptide repeat protein [uncultured Photobacterium sp.]